MEEIEKKIELLKQSKAEKIRKIEEVITRIEADIQAEDQSRAEAYKAGNPEAYREHSVKLKQKQEDLSFMTGALNRAETEPFITAEETAALKAEIMEAMHRANDSAKEKAFTQIREILKEREPFYNLTNKARDLMTELLVNIGRYPEALAMPDPEQYCHNMIAIQDCDALTVYGGLEWLLPEKNK